MEKKTRKWFLFGIVSLIVILLISINVYQETLIDKYDDSNIEETLSQYDNGTSDGYENEANTSVNYEDEITEEVSENDQEIDNKTEEVPDRLKAAKERLAKTYPDSFATQETLYRAEEEAYGELIVLWHTELTPEEQEDLKETNDRLTETYFDSPSTHLTLLKAEIESYRNVKN